MTAKRRQWGELPLAAQAALRCNDRRFRHFIGAWTASEAAMFVRAYCGVKSRRDLDGDEEAATKWFELERRYLATLDRW